MTSLEIEGKGHRGQEVDPPRLRTKGELAFIYSRKYFTPLSILSSNLNLAITCTSRIPVSYGVFPRLNHFIGKLNNIR